MQNLDNQIIFGVACNSKWGQPGIHHGINQSHLQFCSIFFEFAINMRKKKTDKTKTEFTTFIKAMVLLQIIMSKDTLETKIKS